MTETKARSIGRWVVAIAVWLFAFAAAGLPAARADVAVVGSAALPTTIEGGVVVVRGQPSTTAPAAPDVAVPVAPGALSVAAGDRLWLVDRARGRVVGCRLGGSGRVGRLVIRCAERSLAGIVRK